MASTHGHGGGRRKGLVVLGVASLPLLALLGCGQRNTFIPPAPDQVTVRQPLRQTVTTYKEFTGSAQGFETVDLRARVKGFLQEIKFRPGADVKKGQLLFVIEEAPYKAEVAVAEAKVAEAEAAVQKAKDSKAREIARAQVAVDQAMLALARIEEARQRSLLSRNAASAQEVDRAVAELQKTQAQVEADRENLRQAEVNYTIAIDTARANLDEARANLDQARLNLEYCRITAPVDGLISRNYVDRGNLVGDNQSTLLATIVRYNPIHAYFTISESDLLRFRAMRREGRRPDFLSEPIPMGLGLANESGFPHEGQLEYADPGLDPETGTIMGRAVFPNPDRVIVPGAFVRLRLPYEIDRPALLVPESSLVAGQVGRGGQIGRAVLVVDEHGKVDQREVVVGSRVGDMVVIESGLEPDEWFVVNGLQRARPGATVKPERETPTTAAAQPPVTASVR